ncbi:aspartate kinase [Heliobacillus mobilis]|uniref:Aspartokinase n=1 Tax=Heliobacterium mobile TaxID=28064 RepID=A0A6I3SN80_HELMO|nr:aspartate kinase [Heliobacterium mobile]MTV50483.1 aspartate kinase [Heliobacterium mobile]
MKIAVQKFGGTSVADETIRQQALQRIQEAVAEGYRVVVVVSAMGRKGAPYATDTLLSLIPPVELPEREKDLLLVCGEIISAVVMTASLHQAGIDGACLSGWQAGIITSSHFGDARIIRVETERLSMELQQRPVVVVAGFQGMDEKGEITTLGRGGSDTSAVAIGAALKADVVDIFTDVEGIYTADPRLVTDAKILNKVTYREVSQLALEGAKVIHPRAVEIAMKHRLALRVRSTEKASKGTSIGGTKDMAGGTMDFCSGRLITGIAHTAPITQIKIDISPWPDPRAISQQVFLAMADAGISVDFINVSPKVVIFTVPDEVTAKATRVLEEQGLCPEVHQECAKVAVVGVNMTGVPGVMAQIVVALNRENVQILQSADSYTTIWCLIRARDLAKALNALHRQFCLEAETGQTCYP